MFIGIFLRQRILKLYSFAPDIWFTSVISVSATGQDFSLAPLELQMHKTTAFTKEKIDFRSDVVSCFTGWTSDLFFGEYL